jgi:hypothetical protein
MDELASRRYPVREDMRFQRRSWLVERAGWFVLIAIAVAGLSGIFGNGPASWGHATAGPLSVSYQRFERATRLSPFVFTMVAASGHELTLRLSAPFQRDFEFTSIQPPPLRSSTGPDGIELTFAAQADATSRIVIWAHSRHYGISRITATPNGGAPASFWVFVYP